jgi:hypothetical protein
MPADFRAGPDESALCWSANFRPAASLMSVATVTS